MKYKLIKILALTLTGFYSTSFAQNTYSYDDYFYYRNNLYLNTPFVLLNAANYKILGGDTAMAITIIEKAAAQNLYDTGFVISNSRLKFIRDTKQWKGIKTTIEKNRIALSDPARMEINTSDLDNFWKIFDKSDKPGLDKLIMDEYIMKGTQGLRTFFELRIGLRSSNLVEMIKNRRKYLVSIRPVTQQLNNFKPGIRLAAKKLKELYPSAIFPPTTFCIGSFAAFGTADGGSGQLIGAEFLCDTNTAVTHELSKWQKTVIADTSRMLGILIHELIHVEQQTHVPKTLLERSINEGAADFITQLVLGYNLNSHLHEYGNLHESELREKFKNQMDGEDVSEWLYNGNNEKRQVPADLGYYVGYKICEAYYKKVPDKKVAVKNILTIADFKNFLEESAY